MIPTKDTCDLWTPAENIDPTGRVDTPTYSRARYNLRCNTHDVSDLKKASSGLDVTASMLDFFIYTPSLTELTEESILRRSSDGTVWQVTTPPVHRRAIVGPSYWQVRTTEHLTPPDEITDYYA